MTAHRELILPRRLSHIGRRVRLPEEPEEAEEYDEDEEPEEESKPWTDFYEKTVPAGNGGGYYQFCKVQFKGRRKSIRLSDRRLAACSR